MKKFFSWLPRSRHFLANRKNYENQIQRLSLKLLSSPWRRSVKQEGVEFLSILYQQKSFTKTLARAVSQQSYSFQPAQIFKANIGEKIRELYKFALSDLLVHGVVADFLISAMNQTLSHRLYSYRKGKNWTQAVLDFARYVRTHRRAHPDPKDRGLYVIRRDIKSYTDTIPVHDNSPLWPILRKLLLTKKDNPYWPLFQGVIRPVITADDGAEYCRIYGVPTGSPISTVLFNLYLSDMDQVFEPIADGFYCRYSDDLIFAHPDHQVAVRVASEFEAFLHARGLRTNPAKSQNLFFNGAARPAPFPGWEGAAAVPLLGFFIDFHGVVRLKANRSNELLREIRERAQRTAQLVKSETAEIRAQYVCKAINAALFLRSASHHKASQWLQRIVTDRTQLREIDYQIARIALKAIIGSSSVKNFRLIPYRDLRKKYHLFSFARGRDRSYKHGVLK